MNFRHFILVPAGIALFTTGVVIGQVSERTKFSKYQTPANITKLDWILMDANIEMLRDLMPDETGIGVPHVYFDSAKRKICGIALVNPDILKNESANSLRAILLSRALTVKGQAAHDMPEIDERDIEVEFRSWRIGPNQPPFYVLAEFKNGELMIHRISTVEYQEV
jgi:hypothetical protein